MTMPDFPAYYKSDINSNGRYGVYAVLSSTTVMSAIHNKNRHSHILTTTVKPSEVLLVLRRHRNGSLKEISSKQFYNHYLMIRRSLNKHCVNFLKQLNREEILPKSEPSESKPQHTNDYTEKGYNQLWGKYQKNPGTRASEYSEWKNIAQAVGLTRVKILMEAFLEKLTQLNRKEQ